MPKDYLEAMECYRLAAAGGDAYAKRWLEELNAGYPKGGSKVETRMAPKTALGVMLRVANKFMCSGAKQNP